MHTMGVSAEPEMSEHSCDAQDCFLILATDGIWDVIESAQAVQVGLSTGGQEPRPRMQA